ncbi:MAG TPA: inositol monophosphatase family protein, partial [Acidobacteriota bacterium]|nr:inositol monophosphatase family protein [Acidobacteriota bacterium]
QAKYGLVATGKADFLVRLPSADRPDYREKIWDHAAGALVVEEAGGRVTDLAGRSLDFSTGRRLEHNRGLVASNGRLHQAILESLQACFLSGS